MYKMKFAFIIPYEIHNLHHQIYRVINYPLQHVNMIPLLYIHVYIVVGQKAQWNPARNLTVILHLNVLKKPSDIVNNY